MHTRKNFEMRSAVLSALLLWAGSGSAQVTLTELRRTDTGTLASHEAHYLRDQRGELRAVAMATVSKLGVWNLTRQRKEESLYLPIAHSEGSRSRISHAEQLEQGEIVAIVTSAQGQSQRKVLLANLGMHSFITLSEAADVGEVQSFRREDGTTVLGISLYTSQKPWVSMVVEANTLKVLATRETERGGSFHFYEQNRELRSLVLSYDTVETWNISANQSTPLVVRPNAGLFPRILRDGTRELLMMDSPVEGETAVYDVAALKLGKVHLVRNLGLNQQPYEIGGQLYVRELLNQGHWKPDTALRIRAFDSDKILGQLPVDFQVSSESLILGDTFFGLISGRTQPDKFVSPGKMIFGDLKSGKTLFQYNTEGEIGRVDLKRAGNGDYIGAVAIGFDSTNYFNFTQNTVLQDSSEALALTPLMSLAGGRISSLVGNILMHEICAVDWSDQTRHCLNSDVINVEAARYGYYQVDQAALAAGLEVAVPVLEKSTKFNFVATGFQTLRLQ